MRFTMVFLSCDGKKKKKDSVLLIFTNKSVECRAITKLIHYGVWKIGKKGAKCAYMAYVCKRLKRMFENKSKFRKYIKGTFQWPRRKAEYRNHRK